MIACGYKHGDFNDPKLVSSMEGVASFDGSLKFAKIVPSRSIGKIITGFTIAVLGLVLMITGPGVAGLSFFGLVLIIIGIVIMSVKTKTELIIEITLEGESYQYKGQKETKSLDVEKRERADVVSDLRLTLVGKKSNDSKKAEEILINDLSFLDNKLSTIVPNFRVPTVKQ